MRAELLQEPMFAILEQQGGLLSQVELLNDHCLA